MHGSIAAEARHFRPNELFGLDLDVPDPRVAWATEARASSEWSSSYAASAACGAPCVYPAGGDEHGTWLAARDDGEPWLELGFPELPAAAAIIVCETCGPGCTIEIRDLDRDVALYEAEAKLATGPLLFLY
ncbi:MAG: hypothetical protein KF729_35825 [Sandaracinaceae bacterium]|nr:hypothetical protein [Sandaracinaceae bacterium]